jgi:hypothetical protein
MTDSGWHAVVGNGWQWLAMGYGCEWLASGYGCEWLAVAVSGLQCLPVAGRGCL